MTFPYAIIIITDSGLAACLLWEVWHSLRRRN